MSELVWIVPSEKLATWLREALPKTDLPQDDEIIVDHEAPPGSMYRMTREQWGALKEEG